MADDKAESRPVSGALLSAARTSSNEEEEDEALQDDRPGQIDSQRGRTAYSQAEKAGAQFETREADLRQRNAQTAEREDARQRELSADAAQERRHREEEHSLRLQQTQQGLIFAQAMQTVQVFAAMGVATAMQGGENLTLADVASFVDKIVSVTPPPTGGGAA